MGALPRLKLKDELKYRKGHTNESMNCRFCVNRIPNILLDYSLRGTGDRCLVMGNRGSVRYRIRPEFTCERQKYNGQ
jgi:hypothetical protein